MNQASYLCVPLCPGHMIRQKFSRNLARMGLWGTDISEKLRGRCFRSSPRIVYTGIVMLTLV